MFSFDNIEYVKQEFKKDTKKIKKKRGRPKKKKQKSPTPPLTPPPTPCNKNIRFLTITPPTPCNKNIEPYPILKSELKEKLNYLSKRIYHTLDEDKRRSYIDQKERLLKRKVIED